MNINVDVIQQHERQTTGEDRLLTDQGRRAGPPHYYCAKYWPHLFVNHSITTPAEPPPRGPDTDHSAGLDDNEPYPQHPEYNELKMNLTIIDKCCLISRQRIHPFTFIGRI